MNFKNKIIGIAGNARSGKDTLGANFKQILAESGIKAETFSFADELKKSVDEFLINEIGISAFTTDSKEKALIRPFLVCWGTDIKRKMDDSVWINKLESSLSDDKVCIITDMRFKNEFEWIRDLGGLTVFIGREGVEPANEYEKINNNELCSSVDLSFQIGNFEDSRLIYLTANEILDTLINNDIFELWKATCH